MRPYRGKPVDKSVEWVYGSLITHNAYDLKDGVHEPEPKRTFIQGQDIKWHGIGDKCWMFTGCEVIPESVGQQTGLKDKSGKGDEIYGGDKIRITSAKDMFNEDGTISMKKGELLEELTVIFCKGAFWLGSDFIPDKHLLKMISPDSNWQGEIIGTVHENPELLEQA